MKDGNLDCKLAKKLASSNHQEMDNRWREICQRIRIDTKLDDERQQQIWGILERYQDVSLLGTRENLDVAPLESIV
jgi:hypothetical protein